MQRTITTVILTLALSAFTIQAVEQTAFKGAGVIESTTGGFKFPDGTVQTSASLELRSFYLTIELVPGDQAYNACAAGYHFAGMAEIWDTSNFYYDIELGRTWSPTMQGPPADMGGWINTATFADSVDNCFDWVSSDSEDTGYMAHINSHAMADNLLWKAYISSCDAQRPVWCVLD